MIVTLTPNPSLDRTVALPGPLIRGGVNRLSGVVVEPGGKGVNVARVLASAGQPATAVLPPLTTRSCSPWTQLLPPVPRALLVPPARPAHRS